MPRPSSPPLLEAATLPFTAHVGGLVGLIAGIVALVKHHRLAVPTLCITMSFCRSRPSWKTCVPTSTKPHFS